MSLILPVHNAERSLADRFQSIVEVVSELSAKLEVFIIDDGSQDNTEEVAMELSFLYPQVAVIRNSTPLGAEHAAEVGISRSSHEIILVHNIDAPLSDEGLRRLWEMRNDEELVIARSEVPGQGGAAQGAWMDFGTKLLRRQAVEEVGATHEPAVLINRVTRTDLRPAAPVPSAISTRVAN